VAERRRQPAHGNELLFGQLDVVAQVAHEVSVGVHGEAEHLPDGPGVVLEQGLDDDGGPGAAAGVAALPGEEGVGLDLLAAPGQVVGALEQPGALGGAARPGADALPGRGGAGVADDAEGPGLAGPAADDEHVLQPGGQAAGDGPGAEAGGAGALLGSEAQHADVLDLVVPEELENPGRLLVKAVVQAVGPGAGRQRRPGAGQGQPADLPQHRVLLFVLTSGVGS